MAKFEVSGLEDVGKMLLRREKAAVEAVPEMVKAGAEILKKAQRAEIESTFTSDRTSGDLAASIRATPIKNKPTETYCHVYPHGKNRRGQHNATVGFVHQYGRKNMPARPWLTAANAKAEAEVSRAMYEVWRDKQK